MSEYYCIHYLSTDWNWFRTHIQAFHFRALSAMPQMIQVIHLTHVLTVLLLWTCLAVLYPPLQRRLHFKVGKVDLTLNQTTLRDYLVQSRFWLACILTGAWTFEAGQISGSFCILWYFCWPVNPMAWRPGEGCYAQTAVLRSLLTDVPSWTIYVVV